MKHLDMEQATKSICEAIKAESEATEEFVRDVELFLNLLPADLGKGSLNGMKAQLQNKCRGYLVSVP